MGLTSTNALVAIAVGGGAPTNQAAGQVLSAGAGIPLTWSLQSTNNVRTWSVTIQCDDATLNGIVLQWQAGQVNQLFLKTPAAPFNMTYTSVVSDAASSIAQVIGQVQATNNAASVTWPITIPAGSTPEISQTQAQSGAGLPMRFRAEAAATGSTTLGGDVSLILGKSDPAVPASLGPFAWIGASTGPGTTENPPTNYLNYAIFKWLAGGGVVNLVLGGGTDNGGGGLTGIELSTFRPLSIATENNSSITLEPSNGSGIGQAVFQFLQDSNNGPAVSFSSNSSAMPPALDGMIRFPWETSSTEQEIFDQRNATNTGDLSLLSRQQGVLTHGSLAEPQNVWGANSITYQVGGSGSGHTFIVPSGNIAAFGIDNNFTWVQGDSFPVQFDSWSTPRFAADTTATTAHQTIATVPIPAGTNTWGATHLRLTIEGLDTTNGNNIGIFMAANYSISGGVLTAAGNANAAIIDDHSAAATGTAPQLAISGSNVLVQVTPWATNKIHWTTRVERNVNAGQKPIPTTPPGSPVFWWRADLQGLGVASSLTDQSGNGHNLTTIITGTARTVTAGSGPGGTLPSLQFNAACIYGIANALGIGTKNFTIAIVGQVTSVSSGQQAFVCVGTGATNGTAIGVDLNVSSERGAFQSDGVHSNAIADGGATTSWEAWVFSSDASGNLTLLVNGVNQPLTPSNQTSTAPGANFIVGGNLFGTYQLAGALFEVIAYSSIESGSAIYTYQHGQTGL